MSNLKVLTYTNRPQASFVFVLLACAVHMHNDDFLRLVWIFYELSRMAFFVDFHSYAHSSQMQTYCTYSSVRIILYEYTHIYTSMLSWERLGFFFVPVPKPKVYNCTAAYSTVNSLQKDFLLSAENQ